MLQFFFASESTQESNRWWKDASARKHRITQRVGNHRLHRSCDGDRPCQRCRVTGKGSSCQSLAKPPTLANLQQINGWTSKPFRSIFHQSTNFSTAIPPVPILPAPTTTIIFETTASNRNEEAKDVLHTELLHRVQQVQEMTQSLQIQQKLLSEQLLSLQSAQPPSPPNETDRSISSSASPLETNSSPFPTLWVNLMWAKSLKPLRFLLSIQHAKPEFVSRVASHKSSNTNNCTPCNKQQQLPNHLYLQMMGKKRKTSCLRRRRN